MLSGITIEKPLGVKNMKNFLLFTSFFLLILCQGFAGEEITGFWKTINEKTGRAECTIAIYEYQGKYYGRIVATFDEQGEIADTIDHPHDRAPGVVGNPYYAGLDIIWNLQQKGTKYTNGKILDPEKGRVYGAELWRQDDNLVVRGKLLCFGRNQIWLPVNEEELSGLFTQANLPAFIPNIPKVK